MSRQSALPCVATLPHTHCVMAGCSQRSRTENSALAQKPGDPGVWPGSATHCMTQASPLWLCNSDVLGRRHVSDTDFVRALNWPEWSAGSSP